MKVSIGYVLTATLAVGAAARSHGHVHRHVKRSEVGEAQGNVPPTKPVKMVVETAVAYKLDGKMIPKEQAEEGLRQSIYEKVSDATSNAPPPAKDTTLPSPHEGPPEGSKPPVAEPNAAQNEGQTAPEQKSDHPPPPAEVAPDHPAAKGPVDTPLVDTPPVDSALNEVDSKLPPAPKPDKSHGDGAGSSDGSGDDKGAHEPPPDYSSGDFPDRNVSCSEFPSKWGAVSKSRLNLHGWVGIQGVSGIFTPGIQITSGTHYANVEAQESPCKVGTLCSYACPDGMDKAQFPEQQPGDLQSAGGIFCNKDNMLERTNKNKPLCEAGQGGVFVENNLSLPVVTCRTDYPGTEAMVLDTTANPGQTVELFNPLQTRYMWDKKTTSAQYYVNNPGVSVEQACNWGQKSGDVGNWAPTVIGTGVTDQGLTFGSLSLNEENGQIVKGKLECDVEVLIDNVVQCRYDKATNVISENHNSVFVPTAKGCTVSAQRGQKTVYRFIG